MKIDGGANPKDLFSRASSKQLNAPLPNQQQAKDEFLRGALRDVRAGADGLDQLIAREGTQAVARNLGSLTWDWLKKGLPETDDEFSLEALRLLLTLFRKSSPVSFDHSNRVADLAQQMMEELDLDPDERRAVNTGLEMREVGMAAIGLMSLSAEACEKLAIDIRGCGNVLHRAGALHDIGKLSVPANILDKPGKLTLEELRLMRLHPLIGEDLLRPLPNMQKVLPAVRGHHERWDGKGYPDGLAGEEIPLAARILCLCDSYDAMTGERPYREPFDRHRALVEIVSAAGSQFDPNLAGVFVSRLSRGSAA